MKAEMIPLFVIAVALTVTGIIMMIKSFLSLSKDERNRKVREWLLYAVIEAEKQFGSGTGKLKLRYVYDLFLTKFPYLAKVMPFDSFSWLVDEALSEMRNLIETNQNIASYIE